MNSGPRLFYKRDGRMSGDTEPIPRDSARPSKVVPRKMASGRRPADSAHSVGKWLWRMLYGAGWQKLLAFLFLAAVTISIGFADTTTDRMLLPIGILGENGTTGGRTATLQVGKLERGG